MTMDAPEAGPAPARVPLWTLTRNGRTATCEAAAHPLGLEVVATVAGDIVRTQVARTPEAAQVVAEQWRALFAGKGWQA